MKFLTKSVAATLLLASGSAMATCPPILPCKMTGEASTIAGSNADTELIKFAQDITSSSNAVAQSIIDSANANAAALQQSTQSIIATDAELSQIKLAQNLQLQKAMSEKDMAHKMQIAENEYRARASVVAEDDTKEEFEVILKYLEEHGDMSVPEIVQVLMMAYDKDDVNGKVLVPIKVAEGACTEEDIKEKGLCSIPKRVAPGGKLQALFKQCTLDKRMLLEKESEKKARVAAVQITDQKTSEAMNTTNSVSAAASRIEKQRILSCSPNEFKNKLCATDKTIEEYQKDIVIGNIIPNGDISASNFSNPSISSAEGFIDDLSEDARNQIKNQSLNRVPLQEYPTQKIIPFNYTYRNANQVKAALTFVDTIVADDMIPALNANARRKLENAEYQSRHMSRIAALSMARLSLMDSMSQRIGEEMQKMLDNGAFESNDKFEIAADSPANKESVLGNGPLDMLIARVEQNNASIQPPSANGESANAGNDFVTASSSADLTDKLIESVSLQNEMLFKEILINEQMLSMQAISLAQKANSKSMTELMAELRKGQ